MDILLNCVAERIGRFGVDCGAADGTSGSAALPERSGWGLGLLLVVLPLPLPLLSVGEAAAAAKGLSKLIKLVGSEGVHRWGSVNPAGCPSGSAFVEVAAAMLPLPYRSSEGIEE